jgi:hypothetical protein
MLANADLHAAFSACLGLADSPVPWYGVLLVYVAAAGLVWSGSLILAGGAQPADRRDNTA